MADNPYEVVGSPSNYAAPMVNLFGGQQSQGQPQQNQNQQNGQNFVQALQKFLQSGQAMGQPGAPMQLQTGPMPSMNPTQIGSLY